MSSQNSEPDVSSLIKQLNALRHAELKDDATRQALYDATRNLNLAVEAPGDSIQRIAYSPLQMITARLASDISLFEALSSQEASSFSTDELASITQTNGAFLGRILRFLASFGMLQEVSEDHWTANNVTKTLSVPGLKAGIFHNHDTVSPCWQALPQFLAETGYQSPADGAKSPFQKAHGTDLIPFLWLQQKPTQLMNFGLWAGASREGQKTFLDVFPFEKELASNTKPETPLFVDIGGGIGPQCVALRQRLPDVPGRVVLQDQPPVLAHAIPFEGVEPMAHNFMKEQPIKGARSYYLRNIMHDYPDETCILILQNVIKAMSADSVILIDDMIIPNQGADWRAAQLDLTMMASLAGVERTEKQWRHLLNTAGLQIKQICTYTLGLGDSIIVAVPVKA